MKTFTILAAFALLVGGAVTAQAGPMKGGLGFHLGDSPAAGLFSAVNPLQPQAALAAATIGGRQWLTEQIGVDAAVGFNRSKSHQGTQRETWTGLSLDIGLPIVVQRLSHVNFILRPGLQYGRLTDKDETPIPATTLKYTMIGFSGSLEAEWYVTENLSVSAAHGVAWASLKDNGNPAIELSSIGTTGSNFTQLGFNLYIW